MGLFDAVAAAAAPAHKLRWITWSESLAGVQFGQLPYQGNHEQFALRQRSSPAWTLNIAQDKLEGILYEGLARLGGSVCYGHHVVGAIPAGKAAARRPVALRNRDHSLSNALSMVEVDDAIGASTLAPVDPAVVGRPPTACVAQVLRTNSAESAAKRRASRYSSAAKAGTRKRPPAIFSSRGAALR